MFCPLCGTELNLKGAPMRGSEFLAVMPRMETCGRPACGATVIIGYVLWDDFAQVDVKAWRGEYPGKSPGPNFDDDPNFALTNNGGGAAVRGVGFHADNPKISPRADE